jgi:hypothetical protein
MAFNVTTSTLPDIAGKLHIGLTVTADVTGWKQEHFVDIFNGLAAQVASYKVKSLFREVASFYDKRAAIGYAHPLSVVQSGNTVEYGTIDGGDWLNFLEGYTNPRNLAVQKEKMKALRTWIYSSQSNKDLLAALTQVISNYNARPPSAAYLNFSCAPSFLRAGKCTTGTISGDITRSMPEIREELPSLPPKPTLVVAGIGLLSIVILISIFKD